MNFINFWWAMPTSIQDFIKKLVPDKDTWSLNIKKDKTGVWTFSIPQFLTFKESLCNGTEEAIDWWYQAKTGKEAVTGNKMTVTVSKTKPESFDTKLIWLYSSPLWNESNFYLEPKSDKDIWLCPYNQVLFKEVPETIYTSFSIN